MMTSTRFSLERCPRSRAAFTLLELLVIVAVVAALAVLLLPRSRTGCGSPSVRCVSNQKQVVLGMIVWANDYEKERFPFRLAWWEGGSSPGPVDRSGPALEGPPPGWGEQQASQSWFQFAWLSNELINPKILVCPADKEAVAAENFTAAAGGLTNPSFQNKSVSYALALDPAAAVSPPGVLLADRNLDVGLNPDKNAPRCSSGVRPNAIVRAPVAADWRNRPSYGHGSLGNVATVDGAVHRMSTSDLQKSLAETIDASGENGLIHLLLPDRK